MRITAEQEAHLYTIDNEAAAITKMIRQCLDVSYEKALQLMEEYAQLPSDEDEKFVQGELL